MGFGVSFDSPPVSRGIKKGVFADDRSDASSRASSVKRSIGKAKGGKKYFVDSDEDEGEEADVEEQLKEDEAVLGMDKSKKNEETKFREFKEAFNLLKSNDDLKKMASVPVIASSVEKFENFINKYEGTGNTQELFNDILADMGTKELQSIVQMDFNTDSTKNPTYVLAALAKSSFFPKDIVTIEAAKGVLSRIHGMFGAVAYISFFKTYGGQRKKYDAMKRDALNHLMARTREEGQQSAAPSARAGLFRGIFV